MADLRKDVGDNKLRELLGRMDKRDMINKLLLAN